jgi:tetratricopeptide (TPR) repeat protein
MRPRQIFAVLLLLLASSLCIHAQDEKPAAATDPIQAADKLFHSGKTDEAAAAYEALLKTDAAQAHVRAMLIRTRLLQQKVDEANELAKAGLALPTATTELVTAMGDVLFRMAEMTRAESYYLHALKANPREARAHLGLARLYTAYSMYAKTDEQLRAAHDAAPDDPEVRIAWLNHMPRSERIRFLEEYLATQHPDNPGRTRGLKVLLEFLKATAKEPPHPCRLVNKVERTEIRLNYEHQHLGNTVGVTLDIKVNGHGRSLMVDTGASGILLNRKAAEDAGVKKLAETTVGGIGGPESQVGYVGVAQNIRIGELEFEDCLVRVAETPHHFGDYVGLIGTNSFASYLVDLDISELRLRLSPLPPYPQEASEAAALQTSGSPEDSTEKSAASDAAPPIKRRLHDRYIAPEMANWLPVLRFGHALMLPTQVNDSRPLLFVLDSGAFDSVLATRAAKGNVKTYLDRSIHVMGISGMVPDAYRTEHVSLRFGNFRQENDHLISFELSKIATGFGTEVSGILGRSILSQVDLKIDYRDGLVNLEKSGKH